MGLHRIIYVLTLTVSVLFYALYPHWFSWYLTILIILLIPFDFLFSLPGMITKRISLAAPNVLEQGAEGGLSVVTYQNKHFPAGWMKTNVLVDTDDYDLQKRITCAPENGSRYEIAIDTSHSGVILYSVKRIRTTSLLGLFSISIAVDLGAKALVLPAPVRPPRIISLPRGVIVYPKPGGGFSEDNDLRPYRWGDPVKIIHWKLSAKHDSLIIREPLYPPSLSRLVHVMRWNGAQERDTILGRLRWISEYLLKWDLSFCVKLGDDGPVAEITSNDDFLHYLYRVLDSSAPESRENITMPARFSWVFRVDAKGDNA